MEAEEYIKMGELEKNHWYFKAKRKFLDILLVKYITEYSGKIHVLDVGCGTGAVLEQMAAKHFTVSGVDINDTALAYCRDKGFQVERGSADKMPYASASFDIVFALDVLEHLENPELALQEVKRVLKKDGLFIVTVPAHQWLWSYHDESLHHKKRYSKQGIHNLLHTQLQVLQVSWIHAFILLPGILLRSLKNFVNKKNNGSDVKESSVIINHCMSVICMLEFALFKLFGTLPFGLSLLAVGKKKD